MPCKIIQEPGLNISTLQRRYTNLCVEKHSTLQGTCALIGDACRDLDIYNVCFCVHVTLQMLYAIKLNLIPLNLCAYTSCAYQAQNSLYLHNIHSSFD